MADDGSSAGWTLLKGGLLALGGLAAVFLVIGLAKPLLLLGLIAGGGYFGYKVLGRGHKALPGKDQKALKSGDDFERRMRELDAVEKRLDAQIRKG